MWARDPTFSLVCYNEKWPACEASIVATHINILKDYMQECLKTIHQIRVA